MARKITAALNDSSEYAPHIQCAHETCGQSAMCSVKMPTGWAKLCLSHYDAYYRDQGHKAMERYGLIRKPTESHESFSKHVRQFWKDLAASASIMKRSA